MSTNAQEFPVQTANRWDASKRHDERVFRLILVFTFPFFLAVVLLGRLLPSSGSIDGHGRTSIFSEASATARSTIAVALMN
jgi:hypothetical protein